MEMISPTTGQRRVLHFDRIDEAIADAKQLAAADLVGRARCVGVWTLGQNLNHLAVWADYAFDGNPLKVPFILRLIIRPLKSRILHKPMKPGSRIPGVPGGTLAPEPVPTDLALTHFENSFARLRDSIPTAVNPILGKLTHEEWIALNLRHAELHLSFVRMD